jgi:hypothetical protein
MFALAWQCSKEKESAAANLLKRHDQANDQVVLRFSRTSVATHLRKDVTLFRSHFTHVLSSGAPPSVRSWSWAYPVLGYQSQVIICRVLSVFYLERLLNLRGVKVAQ